MNREEIKQLYQGYLACLNGQDWPSLHLYVAEDVAYNGKHLGLDGYRKMLVGDFKAIPDLAFNAVRLVCDPPMIGSRLDFDCTPVGDLFGLPVNGRRVRFSENVFYEIADGRIINVWSVIDKAAIEAQL